MHRSTILITLLSEIIMNDPEAISFTAKEALRNKISWARYITGLSTGSFALLVTFQSNLEESPLWPLRICFCLLALTTLLGTRFLLSESACYERLHHLTKIEFLSRDPYPSRSPYEEELYVYPILEKKEETYLKSLQLSFLVSIFSLLVFSLMAIGG